MVGQPSLYILMAECAKQWGNLPVEALFSSLANLASTFCRPVSQIVRPDSRRDTIWTHDVVAIEIDHRQSFNLGATASVIHLL